MTRPIFSRAVWVLAPDHSELERLGKIFRVTLDGVAQQQLYEAFRAYSWDRARIAEGVSPSMMRKHLKKLASSCRESAALLAGKESIFQDWDVIEPPRGVLPRDSLANETRRLLRLALQSRDTDILAKYKIDPELRSIEPLPLALQLAQLGVAADMAVKRIPSTKGGRPSGGSKDLVESLIDVLVRAGAKISCRFDATEDKFAGSFVRASVWLTKVGMREQSTTLCQYAASYLRRREKKNKLPPPQRVHS